MDEKVFITFGILGCVEGPDFTEYNSAKKDSILLKALRRYLEDMEVSELNARNAADALVANEEVVFVVFRHKPDTEEIKEEFIKLLMADKVNDGISTADG
jgi:hypothetical protein